MLKKILITLGIVSIISFTSCGGESSKEARELLNKILQFVGIPHSIIVNVCQDANRDGICGAKELFTKFTIQKGESIEDILRKISLTEDGQYFLETFDPTLPLLVEIQDVTKINQYECKFTLNFDGFKNQKDDNETKEISILESMVDADALAKIEADKFRTLNNTEAQDKYYVALLDSLETNINTLRTNELDKQTSVTVSIQEMGTVTKVNQESADRINGCENNQTCIDEEIKKLSAELLITDDEVLNITGTERPTSTPTPIPIKEAEVKYGKWVKPSESDCENNGARYQKYSKECMAKWENANIICQTIGDTLPTIEILKKVVTDCWENNKNNTLYKACYKEKGFSPNGYWSSTTYASDSSSAWLVHFDGGFDLREDKIEESRVRCIRED